MGRKKASKKNKKQNNYTFLIIKIIAILISIFAILHQGFFGSLFSHLYNLLLGSFYREYALVIIIVTVYSFIQKEQVKRRQNKYINSIMLITIIAWMISSYVYILNNGVVFVTMSDQINTINILNGGILGIIIIGAIDKLVGNIGVLLLMLALIIFTLIYMFSSKRDTIKGILILIKNKISEIRINIKSKKVKKENEKVEASEIKEVSSTAVSSVVEEKISEIKESDKAPKRRINGDIKIHKEQMIPVVEKDIRTAISKEEDYMFPNLDNLKATESSRVMESELEEVAKANAQLLHTTLENFNIQAKVTDIHIGPNITKYEVVPKAGVKVSKFSGISNDLAMALAAKSIRIEAPIPGKSAVGIEIPNKRTRAIYLKDLLLENDVSKLLQIPLGKDISGKTQFMEIDKTPHMLIAGATGSGKSVFINSMVISLLYKATPSDVKMIMIDPKKVELAPYNGIPHLLTPVVTDPKKAAVILKKMVAEMEYRYEMFAKTNVRNIEGYNKRIEKDKDLDYAKFPYIVIIIDELADLMMVASNEVESSIARLAQMARAAGIHLVIATQRPSTDVITGLIKSNIPTRLSFSVSSSIDSRTILDSSGAEKLLGKGDMLYSANGENELVRIQAAFLSDEEILAVVEDIVENNIVENNEDKHSFEKEIEEFENSVELDELYEQAKSLVIEYQRASTSLLQRELKVGFNRASKIMDQLESTNIIAASEGTKPRKVLVAQEEE